MKKEISRILDKLTAGEITLEEANAALAAAGSPFLLDPVRHELTDEEAAAATAGDSPEEINGYGLLDTGTGTDDKVLVKNGELANMDCGAMKAFCTIGGRTYEVKGRKLVAPEK